MLIASHILVAILSLVIAFLSLLIPSKGKIYLSYVFSGLTVISGIILGISAPTNPLQACVMGSLFLGFVIGATFLAKRRIASL